MAVVVAACSAKPASDPNATSQLVVAVSTVGPNLWSVQKSGDDMEKVGIGLYDPLVLQDPKTREYVGNLAESYSLSPDGKTWSFKLRPNVKFHDGWGTVTAEDVKYTWGEWMAEGSDHTSGEILGQAVDNDIDNFEVVNDLEFKLHTTKPTVLLETALGITGLQVTSKKYHEEKGAEADNHPVGTGPWKFVSSKVGLEIVFERNEDYWGTVPAFKRLIYKEVADPSARLAQVQSGQADIAELDASLTKEAEAAGLKLHSLVDCCNAFVVFGGMFPGDKNYDRDSPWIQADNPEKGKAIREAMSLAIDRQLILDQVLRGQGKLAHGVINQTDNDPNTFDPSWPLPEYNVEKAKQKLAEGGYPNGFSFTMPLMDLDINSSDVGEAIAGMWQAIGLKVKLEPTEEAVHRQKQANKTTGGLAWVMVHGADQVGATGYLRYLSSGNNHKFWSKALDDGYEAMLKEPDAEKRWQIYRDVQKSMIDDMDAIPLFSVNVQLVSGPKVGSWDVVPVQNMVNGLETVKPAS
jgi:peptide/nickel transport system substrate-binding protein